MAFKLNRVWIFILFPTFIWINCATKKERRKNYSHENLTKQQWISDFKKIAYYEYLKMGYQHDPKLLKELFEVDISQYDPYYGIIYTESLANIKEYLKREYEDMITDSITNDKRFTPQPGKRVLSKGLDFYTGELLDSLSKEEYKRWIYLPKSKKDSIYGLIAG